MLNLLYLMAYKMHGLIKCASVGAGMEGKHNYAGMNTEYEVKGFM